MNMIHFSGLTDVSRSFIPKNGRLFQERLPTIEHDVTPLLSIGDRHKNRAIACPIDVIF